jgi:hypothetical protein
MTETLIERYVQLVGAIAEALGSHFDARAIRALVHAFELGDGFESYWTTVHVIERFCDMEELYAVIHGAISEGAPGVRKWCCILLGRRCNPRDLPFLLARFGDAEERIVVEALSAIRILAQKHPVPTALPYVKPLLTDPRPAVARAALRVV